MDVWVHGEMTMEEGVRSWDMGNIVQLDWMMLSKVRAWVRDDGLAYQRLSCSW